jgi:uncharacterized membrane protein
MTVASAGTPAGLIRWHYAWFAAAALGVMLAAITSRNFWFLNFVHVFSGLLWTGIDLFIGFVLGPIVRRSSLSTRREIATQLTPRTLFIMPTLATITGTTGWYLAVELGYAALPWPAYGWVAAALTLISLMSVVGFAFLTPVNVLLCLNLQKDKPDFERIGRWMGWYYLGVAAQGTMQVLTIIVMTRFRAGI